MLLRVRMLDLKQRHQTYINILKQIHITRNLNMYIKPSVGDILIYTHLRQLKSLIIIPKCKRNIGATAPCLALYV